MHKNRIFYKLIYSLIFFSFFASFKNQLSAQVAVNLSLERSLYIAYEPLLITTHINNLSGNALLLADDEHHPWFGFCIETTNGTPIPPNNPYYKMAPQRLASGEGLSNTINITSLYPISDFGSYRIHATVYIPEFQRYFSSPPLTFEVSDGRIIWQQNIEPSLKDNPSKATNSKKKIACRNVSLLSHRLPDYTALYLRIKDEDAGIIYCTHLLGSFTTYLKPEIVIDSNNHIHVLHQESPGIYIYTHTDLDGKIIDRKSFNIPQHSPSLTLTKSGIVSVTAGEVLTPNIHAVALPSKSKHADHTPSPVTGPTSHQ